MIKPTHSKHITFDHDVYNGIAEKQQQVLVAEGRTPSIHEIVNRVLRGEDGYSLPVVATEDSVRTDS
ncbi:MAG: hypothetical protein KZQ96_08150 [Candidatus Thiodiazotropha sp. (ex Lucinoma borealis)]|nr:hypothetical protein [Candidatus Thiodiazotropha sp. (ex Lucinoma borealis)]